MLLFIIFYVEKVFRKKKLKNKDRERKIEREK
jgi:hypothetical protein